jgi:signal transduction histidine kinase
MNKTDIRPTVELLSEFFEALPIQRLLCWINAAMLGIIAFFLLRGLARPKGDNHFVVPLLPGDTAPELDLRREMATTLVGLVLFVAFYVFRASAPRAVGPLHSAWSIAVDILIAGGLLRAVGEALKHRVRVSNLLPRPQEPPPGTRRLFTIARSIVTGLHKREPLLAAWTVATVVTFVVLLLAVKGFALTSWMQILDGMTSVVCFGVIALAMGVELTRTETDPLSSIVVACMVAYALLQMVSLVVGVGELTHARVFAASLTKSWYWALILFAVLVKAGMVVGFAGLSGLVRVYTPAMEHQIATEGMVAAGRLGNFLAHQTSHVAGRFRLQLLRIENRLSDDRPVDVGALRTRVSELGDDVEFLSLALDAYYALRGDVRADVVCDIDDILGKLCTILRRDWRDVEITFIPSQGARSSVSRAALVNVVFNVMDNAHRALRTLRSPDRKWIRVEASTTNNRVRIEIVNNGPHVPEDRRLGLFLYPVPGQDWGMGLWACRMLLEDWDGTISYLADRRDTTFVVEFPATSDLPG